MYNSIAAKIYSRERLQSCRLIGLVGCVVNSFIERQRCVTVPLHGAFASTRLRRVVSAGVRRRSTSHINGTSRGQLHVF